MRITPKILYIPPYISTRWDQVTSVRAIGDDAVEVSLANGVSITIPHLETSTIEQIFSCHLQAAEELEKEEALKKSQPREGEKSHSYVQQQELSQFLHILQNGLKEVLSLLMRLGSQGVSSFGKALEHDPKNANLPPLADEMKEKVLSLLNIIPKEDIFAMTPPEPDCNCMYCQISRVLRNAIREKEAHEEEVGNEETSLLDENKDEEIIDERELEFSEWIVNPLSDKLYSVKNKLDPKEEYRVFLGNPIGCTCGKPNCEHIIAVLRS